MANRLAYATSALLLRQISLPLKLASFNTNRYFALYPYSLSKLRSTQSARNVQGYATEASSSHFDEHNVTLLTEAQHYIDIGIDHLSNGLPDMAMDSFIKSLETRPTAEAHYCVGVTYFKMGKPKDAIKSFEASLSLGPGNPNAHTNIAIAHSFEGNLHKALEHLKIAHRLNPTDGEITFNTAKILERMGRLEEAKQEFEEAAKNKNANIVEAARKASMELKKKLDNKKMNI